MPIIHVSYDVARFAAQKKRSGGKAFTQQLVESIKEQTKGRKKMSYGERPIAAVILSIIGGVLMLVGGSMAFMMLSYNNEGYGMMSGFGGMMGGYRGMMDEIGFPYVTLDGLMLVSLASGILFIVGGVMMDIYPSQSRTWAVIVLVFSIISFVGMGGFLVGAILGVVGGALALAWKAKTRD
jgi:hypothetical protein